MGGLFDVHPSTDPARLPFCLTIKTELPLPSKTPGVAAGEFVFGGGPHGCGKSTLLNVGFVAPVLARWRCLLSRSTASLAAPATGSVGRRPDAVAYRLCVQCDRGLGVSRVSSASGARGRRVAQAGWAGWVWRPLPAPNVGRHAQAYRAGANPHPRPRHHLDGRAVFGARYSNSAAHGKRGAGLVASQKKGGPVHHPRFDEAIAMSDRVVVLSAGPATHPIGDFVIDPDRPREWVEIRTHRY